MGGFMEDGIIKNMVASMSCGVCGQSYGTDSITVLGRKEALWVLRVVCPACQTRHLMVAVAEKAAETEHDVTEVAGGEPDKLDNVGKLTADDMLDMHNFLNDFDGDFSRLFGQRHG